MKKLWDLWELKAIEYLKSKWYKILATNYKYGRVWEIDIIAGKDEKTIFVEVKYRKNNLFWIPEESITRLKKQKILLTLENYCIENGINFDTIEFHIISIIGDLESKYTLKHYTKIGFGKWI